MLEYAWLIPVFPFVAFILIGLLPRRTLGWEDGAGYAIVGAGGALIISMLMIWEVINGRTLTIDAPSTEWLVIGGFSIRFGIWIDQLTAVMLVVVSIVGTLVVIYSGGYMHEEAERRRRYYAEIMLFISVMYGLVIANNYLEMFIFWELVGLCSYLLIGFWYEKPSAASAAKRAFIVTRVGDIMFMAGIIILLKYVGALDFATLFASGGVSAVPQDMLTLSTALIFGGAIGKSAQFPLHEWLPDAMEGPTTVSALIHAATMVNAGVYLTARTYPLLVQTPDSLLFVAVIGGITALLAATVALVATDIKRVLAYSTVSQLGYMILGLGAGGWLLIKSGSTAGYSAALFHLMNHGFFKALLFLCAGSVIHSVGTNNMRVMGGLRKKMPITSITMLIGALAIAGIPPLSGFWSKDEVLSSVYHAGQFDSVFLLLWFMGVATAFLTAFYMFRMWFMTFSGEPRSEYHAHESPRIMTVPLMILAGLAAVSGFVLFMGEGFKLFLERSLEGLPMLVPEHESFADIASNVFTDVFTYLVLGLVVAGVLIAYRIYHMPGFDRSVFARGFSGRMQKVLENRWYISKFYDDFALTVWYGFSLIADKFDRYVIDGIVNGFAYLGANLGGVIRKAQSGNVQRYASLIVLGIVLLLIFVVYILPWGGL
ncbi:MAG: NADH-quinone oxidoreductase subunit L [Thermoplasmatota archaeon]|nr:NADH-quinone oxidoreductase subunit L [Candidatus Thermoplasmatota archaeon]